MSDQLSSNKKPPILLATGNPAKQQTLRWLLEGLSLAPVTPQELGLDSVPEEEGETHEEIACRKAQEWSEAASMLAIASDGGLVIPALGNNWESRFTHRFAGPAADDAERLRRLLELMQPYQGQQREASWIEALAIADRGRVLASWELKGSTGVIAEDPGDSPPVPGFWVFSVWQFPQLGKTYNQLSPTEKEALDDHWTHLRHLVQDFFKGRRTDDERRRNTG
jgi:XTP/dITP diphosphohydrolase